MATLVAAATKSAALLGQPQHDSKTPLALCVRSGALSRVTPLQQAPAICRGPSAVAGGKRRRVVVTRASASTSAAETSAAALPLTPLDMVEQAAASVQAALAAGKTRQQLVLLLPVNEKEANFMSTEPEDYPCSLQREFEVAVALVTSIMQRVLGASTNINSKRIDDGGVEGDPCSVLFPDDKSFAAVVFPTADRLKNIQAYAKEEGRTVLIVNPQWNTAGQVISDFGIGPWRKQAEDFLATFEPVYIHREKRIGSPGTISGATGTRFTTGGVVRVRRQFGGCYEAFAMAADGSHQLLAVQPTEPTYKELDALITEGRKKKLEIFEVAKSVTYLDFTKDFGGSAPAPEAGVKTAAEEAEDAAGAGASFVVGLSDADIEAMDATTLRRRLGQLGQPTSGKISKLRERLREVRDGKV